MPCYHPSRVTIHRKSLYVRGGIKDKVEVPCGSCLGCRAEQGKQWAVRMMHEGQMHQSSWFATMTYDEENLPEDGSLCPTDFSQFIKNLRKRYPPRSVSFFGCGEYGEDTQRPHYHAVLFGPQFLDRSRHDDSGGDVAWRSQTLEDSWGHGHTQLGSLTMASASYVSGYVRKKVAASADEGFYERVRPETGEIINLEPEFARMSLRPAIGRSWIQKYWPEVYPADFCVMNGRKSKPPRYYDKWMDENHPKLMMSVRRTRWEEAEQLTDEKLAMKEKIHEGRISIFDQRGKI